MGNRSAFKAADLYERLAGERPVTDPCLASRGDRGTGTFSQETVDEDRAVDRNSGLPLR